VKEEIFRRLVLGELKRIFRGRYGVTLPDDDAGRDDLELLLLHVAADKRQHAIEIWAPWISDADATIAALPLRRPTVGQISERLRLTNAEREVHGLRILRPVPSRLPLCERSPPVTRLSRRRP
jgi:hypothetical protein